MAKYSVVLGLLLALAASLVSADTHYPLTGATNVTLHTGVFDATQRYNIREMSANLVCAFDHSPTPRSNVLLSAVFSQLVCPICTQTPMGPVDLPIPPHGMFVESSNFSPTLLAFLLPCER